MRQPALALMITDLYWCFGESWENLLLRVYIKCIFVLAPNENTCVLSIIRQQINTFRSVKRTKYCMQVIMHQMNWCFGMSREKLLNHVHNTSNKLVFWSAMRKPDSLHNNASNIHWCFGALWGNTCSKVLAPLRASRYIHSLACQVGPHLLFCR